MHVLLVENLTVNYGSGVVFSGLSWAIDDRARIGLVGPNGAGKSTLMKVMAGKLVADDGQVKTVGNVSVGYLPQDIHLPEGETVWTCAAVWPPKLAALDADLHQIEARLADPDVYNNERRLAYTLEQQEKLLIEYERLGMNNFDARVKRVLYQLGFDETSYALPVTALSGGQKKLLALARLALESPDVLLLDEPDNHLDITSKHQLERFIAGYNGAVVLISHDRYLLDEVANHIAELEGGKITMYVGNYSRYTTERELARLRQEQQYVTQQKQIAKIEAAIARFELWAKMTEDVRHIRKARHRRKMLERMEERGEIIEQVTEQRLMDLTLAGHRGSKQALKLEGVTVVLDDNPIIMELDMLVRHGERVGLIGANGAGKSVLFKTILGEFPLYEGLLTVGNSTKIGYYAQEHQTLDAYLKRTPVELVQETRPMSEGAAVSTLLKFAFDYQQSRQMIETMSGGERSRLQLLRLMLTEPNLLLLDEPTNNLDIASVEVLEQQLDSFEGAVLVISHDRYFLDNVVDRVLDLRDGSLTEYLGGYTDYLAER